MKFTFIRFVLSKKVKPMVKLKEEKCNIATLWFGNRLLSQKPKQITHLAVEIAVKRNFWHKKPSQSK